MDNQPIDFNTFKVINEYKDIISKQKEEQEAKIDDLRNTVHRLQAENEKQDIHQTNNLKELQ